MKKMIIIVATTLVTLLTNAAALDWTSNTFRLKGKSGDSITAYEQGGAIVLALLGSDVETFADARVLQTGTIVSSGKASTLGKVSGTYSFTYGDANTPKNGDILAVLYKNSDGDLKKLLNAGTDEVMYTTYTISGMGDDTWTGSAYVFATGNFQEPVPEPTSGLLLLVGASLLALRRKQK